MSRVYVQLAHPPTDREELWWVVRALFGVAIPRVRVCPDHCAPFDAFADAYFGVNTVQHGEDVEPTEQSRFIWKASRGLAGKSYMLSILGATFAYIDGADITILGGSMSQSANVHEYLKRAVESEALDPGMLIDQTATRVTLTNHARVRPLPASQKNVRGPHPSILLIDEADEMELEIYDAALGQPMPQDNYLGVKVNERVVISSTHQNADGCFTEILRRAEEKGQPPPYSWCYKETSAPGGWLTEATIQKKRDDVSAEMFRVEYDLGEPSIGNRAFDTDAVDKAFARTFEPVRSKVEKDFEEYVFATRERGGVYVATADWAKEQDKTVILVARVDRGKREPVYFARLNRRPYPVMVGMYNEALRRYRVGENAAWHDSTGLGNVVNDYVDLVARPFPMTGDKRAVLLSDYVNAVEKGAWDWPDIRSAHLEHKYCKTGDLYSSASGFHLPDTVCAGALAELAARYAGPASFAPVTVKRDDTPPRNIAQFSEQPDPERSPTSPEPALTSFSLLV